MNTGLDEAPRETEAAEFLYSRNDTTSEALLNITTFFTLDLTLSGSKFSCHPSDVLQFNSYSGYNSLRLQGMLQSWVPVPDGSHFPIQNLPLGIFSTEKRNKPRACVAIGDHVLDLQAASKLEPLAKTKAAKLDAFGQVRPGSRGNSKNVLVAMCRQTEGGIFYF